MECCGFDRTTPYCPMCGKVMNVCPAYELLRHIKKYRDSIKADIATSIEIHGEDGNKIHKDSGTKYREGMETRFKKWDSWYKAVVDLLEKRGDKK